MLLFNEKKQYLLVIPTCQCAGLHIVKELF